MSQDLIELLRRFNRKERFFLVGDALGNPSFKLSEDFRERLGNEVGVSIPEDALAAMDYHLDWIAAAVLAHDKGSIDGEFFNTNDVFTGSQEDVDLLVAFKCERDENYHLIFVEAKAYASRGYASFTNSQMASKIGRLRTLFGDTVCKDARVKPKLCLISFSRPTERLKVKNWPQWAKREDSGRPYWIGLNEINSPKGRLKVSRCNGEGNSSNSGNNFGITTAD